MAFGAIVGRKAVPRVTVILPTHNRASLLPRAINSVLAQTFTDFELLVIDDASNDASAQLIRGFSDPRIIYIRHEVNRGEAESRNTGIRHARGEYIAYLDDDDEWVPIKLDKQVKVLDSSPPETGVVYTGCDHIELGTGRKVGTRKVSRRGRVLEHLLRENFLPGPTALVRKKCFQEVGEYDSTVRYGPDWEMWIRIARYFDFEVIPEPLYRYSIHTNQLTANFGLQLAGLERILELHSDLFLKHANAHARQLLQLGLLYYLCGNPAEARVILKRGLRRDPFHSRGYKLFVLSFLSRHSFQRLLALREGAVLW
ncbi:MAG: glycosyl transferase [Acidobacteria bacterium]|nr:MAG: glycosyl transferase [Acidobacteriota bacterium]